MLGWEGSGRNRGIVRRPSWRCRPVGLSRDQQRSRQLRWLSTPGGSMVSVLSRLPSLVRASVTLYPGCRTSPSPQKRCRNVNRQHACTCHPNRDECTHLTVAVARARHMVAATLVLAMPAERPCPARHACPIGGAGRGRQSLHGRVELLAAFESGAALPLAYSMAIMPSTKSSFFILLESLLQFFNDVRPGRSGRST